MLSDAAQRRFGIDLPYDEQLDWGITRLKPEQLSLCIAETHSDAAIIAAVPYPNAVETVRAWHDAGHFIHVTSHRAASAHHATELWLRRIGLPYDELHCSYDKVGRCAEIGVDLLIDDSPLNLAAAIEHGLLVATIAHPWNSDLCEEESVICAADWFELQARLEPLIKRIRSS